MSDCRFTRFSWRHPVKSLRYLRDYSDYNERLDTGRTEWTPLWLYALTVVRIAVARRICHFVGHRLTLDEYDNDTENGPRLCPAVYCDRCGRCFPE